MRKPSDEYEGTTIPMLKIFIKKLSKAIAVILILSLVTQNGYSAAINTENVTRGAISQSKGDGDGKGCPWCWIIPIIPVVIAIGVYIRNWLSQHSNLPPGPETFLPPDSGKIKILKEEGPQLPVSLALNSFSITGLVKGGWPIIMDFSLSSPGTVQVTISVQGVPEIYTFMLSHNQTGRRQVKWDLPEQLGDDLRPALITVAATDETKSAFDMLGIGVGPRAIGSVAIDQLLFGPDKIRASSRDTAKYRFFSHSDFEKVSAEFRKLDSGNTYVFVNAQPIEGGVSAKRWVGLSELRSWDGFDTQKQLSQGIHRLLVRTWHSEGDWVTSLSKMAVNISQ